MTYEEDLALMGEATAAVSSERGTFVGRRDDKKARAWAQKYLGRTKHKKAQTKKRKNR